MKSLICSLALLLLTLGPAAANAQPDELLEEAVPAGADAVDPETWEVKLETFGHSVPDLLASRDDELREIALRLIIRDGAEMKFSREEVHSVVGIYRNHKNPNMRRMAVVALGQMHDAWAMDFLSRSAHFERTPQVLHTLVSVLDRQSTMPTPEPEVPTIARGED